MPYSALVSAAPAIKIDIRKCLIMMLALASVGKLATTCLAECFSTYNAWITDITQKISKIVPLLWHTLYWRQHLMMVC